LSRLLATWFYLGYVPKGPGTAGSLGAILIAWPLAHYFGFGRWAIGLMGILLIAPAVWVADITARELKSKDPQIVVIDEVVGQWMTYAGAVTLNWKSWLLGFLLFRAFDMTKPPPVRQLENLRGGAGIVLDDAMAGVYAALVLFAAGWFNLY
jgi:phosphatidylglycerophosphatase A